jgi:hypothetical protein
MRWSKPAKYDNGQFQDGVCSTCGMDARVIFRPDATRCEITGDALAVWCKTPNGVVIHYGKNKLHKTDHGYMAENSEGLTDWPILQVEPSAPGFERHALWDNPSRFPVKFRQMVSKYILKHEKE